MFKDFFKYKRPSDQRAIILLMAVATFCLTAIVVVQYLRTKDEPSGIQPSLIIAQGKETNGHVNTNGNEAKLREFDPNEVDSLTLIEMGMSAYQVRSLLHYREAGAVFSSAESLGRVYGWEAKDVERVTPYVRIADKYKRGGKAHYDTHSQYSRSTEYTAHDSKAYNDGDASNRHHAEKMRHLTVIDLNAADSASLRQVPGIGEKIASAIIRRREKLGGYYSVEQMREIPIVSPELLEWFKVTSPDEVEKIHINSASFQRLNSHPYISYDNTKAILQYRRLYGSFSSISQLVTAGILNQKELDRLTPYIEL